VHPFNHPFGFLVFNNKKEANSVMEKILPILGTFTEGCVFQEKCKISLTISKRIT